MKFRNGELQVMGLFWSVLISYLTQINCSTCNITVSL
jgi:hypothetical protein